MTLMTLMTNQASAPPDVIQRTQPPFRGVVPDDIGARRLWEIFMPYDLGNDRANLEREVSRVKAQLRQAEALADRLEIELRRLKAESGSAKKNSISDAFVFWLTRHETIVLAALAQRGDCLDKNALFDALEFYGRSRSEHIKESIGVRICNIRRKCRQRGFDPGIMTKWSGGYQIDPARLNAVRALLWPVDTLTKSRANSSNF